MLPSRTLVVSIFALVCTHAACTEAKAPTPPPPSAGACTNGALVGTKEVSCATEHACVLGDAGPACVAKATSAQNEGCGMIACGEGCSCSSAANSECLCPVLGPQ